LAAGQSWRQVNSGLPVTVAGARALAFDPATPSVIYGVGGNGSLFKTSDGGGSWNPISAASSVQSVVVDPENSANVYALARTGVLKKSADYGETWTAANTGLQSGVDQLVIAPTDPPALYAVGYTGGLFKSTDGAQSWHSVNPTLYAGATGPIPHAFIGGVVVDPKNPLTMYATVGGSVAGVFKSTDGGVTWYSFTTPAPSPQTGARIFLPIFNPASPSTIYLWYSDYNFQTKAGGVHLLQSTDDGARWKDIGNGGVPADTGPYSLAFDPNSPATVYASYSSISQGWGVIKSTDGGKSWTQLNTGLPPYQTYQTPAIVSVSPASTVYAGYVDLDIGWGRLLKSADGGTTWSAADSGLTYVRVLTLAIDPTNSANVYAGAGAAGEGVFKTADGGRQWSNLAQLLITAAGDPQGEPGMVNSLLVDFNNPKVLYAATTRIDHSCFYADKILFKSTDGGTSWDNSASPPDSGCEFWYPSIPLTLAPTDSNELYLGGNDGCGDALLDQSSDGGSDWNLQYIDGAVGLLALVADPTNSSTLYASTPQGVFKSTDGGANWTNVNNMGSVVTLAMDPTQPKTLYAAMGNQYTLSSGFQGVFKSVDGGANWAPINTGLDSVFATGSDPTSIAIAPRSPNTLYLTTSGSGIFKSSDGGAHWTPFNENLTDLDVRVLAVAPSGLNRLYAATTGGVFTIVDGPEPSLAPRR
jgi:photosystem II stability/assembly factor-like uncharacterized protein